MSNQVYIEPTKFESIRTREISYGYRMYDDYAHEYCNLLTSIPDDDLELLALVIEYSDNDSAQDMIAAMEEFNQGVTMGNVHYDRHQIEHLFRKEEQPNHITKQVFNKIYNSGNDKVGSPLPPKE